MLISKIFGGVIWKKTSDYNISTIGKNRGKDPQGFILGLVIIFPTEVIFNMNPTNSLWQKAKFTEYFGW